MISIAHLFLLGIAILFTFLRYAYLDKVDEDSEFYKKGVRMATSMVAVRDYDDDDEDEENNAPD